MTTVLSYITENLKLKNANMYLKACHFKSCSGFLKRLWWQQNGCNYIPIFWSASVVYENLTALHLHTEIYCLKYLQSKFCLKLHPQQNMINVFSCKSPLVILSYPLVLFNNKLQFLYASSLYMPSFSNSRFCKWIYRQLEKNKENYFFWLEWKKISHVMHFYRVSCIIRTTHTN